MGFVRSGKLPRGGWELNQFCECVHDAILLPRPLSVFFCLIRVHVAHAPQEFVIAFGAIDVGSIRGRIVPMLFVLLRRLRAC